MEKKLDRRKLKAACLRVAKNTMWDTKPVDATPIPALAEQLFKIAKDHEEFLIGQGRDPNLITRAVLYLEYVHAIPPMKDRTNWFYDMLQVLIELACPNSVTPRRFESFYKDVERGIQEARLRYSERK
jgi:hypothetical protein